MEQDSSGYSLTNSNGSSFTLTASQTTIGIEQTSSNSVAIGAENTTGTNEVSVPVILAPASGNVSTFFQAPGGTLVVNGDISGSGIQLELNTSGSGTATFTLSGNNTYSGGTLLNTSGVTLNINSATAIGSGVLTFGGSATIDNTSANGITLSNNNAINLSGGGLAFIGTRNLSFGTGIVTLIGSNRAINVTNPGATLTVGGIAQDSSARSPTKDGAGTLVVNGTSSYSGATPINAGALQAIDGNGLPTSTILQLRGGVFQSSGTFSRAIGVSPAT